MGGDDCTWESVAAIKISVGINKELLDARSVSTVLDIVAKRLLDFNEVNLATAFSRLAKLKGRHGPCVDSRDLRMRSLLEHELSGLTLPHTNAKARHLANVSHAMASLSGTSSVLDPLFCQVFDSLCRAAAAKVQDFNAQGLANTRAAAAKVQDFNAQGLVNTLWAMVPRRSLEGP